MARFKKENYFKSDKNKKSYECHWWRNATSRSIKFIWGVKFLW